VSEGLPVVSGPQLIKALEQVGWQQVRQRGSHVRLKHQGRALFLVVPLHRELKRGTLNGILRDAARGNVLAVILCEERRLEL
jgi:predicted RNA binding protein YcfA (HicA-like mRNA interferase family)